MTIRDTSGPSRLAATIIAVSAASLLSLTACTTQPEPAPVRGGLVVAPDGSGDSCSTTEPCSLETALDSVLAGSSIQLSDGDYGDLEPVGPSYLDTIEDPIIIEAAEGAEPVIGKLDTFLPNTHWQGVTVQGNVYLEPEAHGTVLDRVHIDGSGLFVRADDVTVTDSLLEGGSAVDGIQFAGAERVLVENTTVRDYAQTSDSDVHADCVQIFDSADITLRGNYLGNCHNASIIFSPGQGDGIRDVTIESNYVQGCVETNERCEGGTLLDMREPDAENVVIRNNTMLDGSVRLAAAPGLVFDRNIVDYVSECDMPMTNTIVARWNTGLCEEPDAIGSDGNRVGEVGVSDRAGGDFTPTDPEEASIEAAGGGEPAAKSFGGDALPADMAGAG